MLVLPHLIIPYVILVGIVVDEKDVITSSAACLSIGEIARKAPLPLDEGEWKEKQMDVDDRRAGGKEFSAAIIHV